MCTTVQLNVACDKFATSPFNPTPKRVSALWVPFNGGHPHRRRQTYLRIGCGIMPLVARLVFASALVVAAPLLAFAADLPLKAAPAPTLYSWTGFYVGISNGARLLDAGWNTTSI